VRARIDYYTEHRGRDGEPVGFTVDDRVRSGEMVLRVEGSGPPQTVVGGRGDMELPAPSERAGTVLVTRDRPRARALLHSTIPRAELEPGMRQGDVARNPVMMWARARWCDEDTSATASWADIRGVGLGDVTEDGRHQLNGSAEVVCDGDQCILALELSMKLDEGEWAVMEIEHLGVDPNQDFPFDRPVLVDLRYE
jgi:hypothetical protein